MEYCHLSFRYPLIDEFRQNVLTQPPLAFLYLRPIAECNEKITRNYTPRSSVYTDRVGSTTAAVYNFRFETLGGKSTKPESFTRGESP